MRVLEHCNDPFQMVTNLGRILRPGGADRLEYFQPLLQQAARWAADNGDELTLADLEILPAFSNRIADNWRPFLAIADLVGGEWTKRARRASEAVLRSCCSGPPVPTYKCQKIW